MLFAVPVYEQVADAYISGLEDYAASGGDIARVASVASFFVSRIDTVVDARLEELAKLAPTAERRSLARGLEGKVAIANAKLAYEHYKETIASDRWKALAERGAHVQRLLWASTGTKNPRYPDLLYVEELIGPDTVNTVPPATFEAFREHGRPRASLEEGVDAAHDTLATLAELGVSLGEITDKLTEDGIELFDEAFAKLFAAIEQSEADEASRKPRRPAREPAARDRVRGRGHDRGVGSERQGAPPVGARPDALDRCGRGASGSAGSGSSRTSSRTRSGSPRSCATSKEAGFAHVLLLGMGGSSLFPELLSLTFGKQDGFPELHVLDSTDPAQVRPRSAEIDLARTLFIVSSKSGTTLEPNIFEQYFFERVSEAVGARGGAEALHRDHRPGLQARAARRGGGLPPCRARRRVDRRALLGPVGLRHGARRGDGRGRARAARPRRADGA